MMKILPGVGKWLLGICLGAIVILIALVAPVNRTPLHEQPFYARMMTKLDTFRLQQFPDSGELKVGWSKVSITPDHAAPMAGYGPREKFRYVHDSIYARILSIQNNSFKAHIISADLLLFPPALKEIITQQYEDDKNSAFYFSATHTHSSVGGWEPGLLGRILMGKYNEPWVNATAEKIIKELRAADSLSQPATLNFWTANADWYVYNRLDRHSAEDGKLRGLQIEREDGSEAILFSYSAHPTLIATAQLGLSGDYPSETIMKLEDSVDFALFLGGMMGSHRLEGMKRHDYAFSKAVGRILSEKALSAKGTPIDSAIEMAWGTVDVEMGPSQLRLTRDWKLRDWVFNAAMRPLSADARMLKLGNLLMIGLSCDFSGEIATRNHLFEYARERGLNLMITSFNGEYSGYITSDVHYDQSKNEEVMALSWVGPYFGEYYTEIIKKLIDKAAAD